MSTLEEQVLEQLAKEVEAVKLSIARDILFDLDRTHKVIKREKKRIDTLKTLMDNLNEIKNVSELQSLWDNWYSQTVSEDFICIPINSETNKLLEKLKIRTNAI